jgi:hypothetical protein
MTYTDLSGRPEIIADPAFKSGPATYRVDTTAADVTTPGKHDDEA